MRRHLSLALTLACGSAAGQSLADRGPPPQRLFYANAIGAQINPLGLSYDGRMTYRLRLYESDDPVVRDNFVGGGLAAQITPASLRVGPLLEVAPVSFLRVWTAFQYSAYFGSADLLQSFPSPRSDYSPDELERRGNLPDGDPLKNYAAGGLEVTVGLDLAGRIGPIVLRASAKFVYADMNLRAGDRTFYDPANDVLVPDRGWIATSSADLLYVGLKKFVFGLRYSLVVPYYTDDSYLPGEPHEDDNRSQRLGPILAYTFSVRDGAAFTAPTVLLLVQWWLQHRYRTGAEVSQALPLIGVGFGFRGDLLPFD
jgi:hypothetical protein